MGREEGDLDSGVQVEPHLGQAGRKWWAGTVSEFGLVHLRGGGGAL
jgi:hypothetical protein